MARKRIREEEEATLDMTPMLDIVFIMLIFFIVTTSFVKEAGIDVNRPEASQATSKPSANIFIAVRENGEVWMDRRQVDVERVAANLERLLAEQPTDMVVIQADDQARHGIVVKVMDQIKEAGIAQISIAAEDD
ncbi:MULTISPECIES: biopolymer transporter ExbD [Gammaproteobacteria]|uniref:ExbD/TolR family protein n=1 Tax=Gammaproteobacteria TaxID=1236 RepID=UPI000DCF79C0|nr:MULTISPECIES: biopolymer transporter ExbD [Gammaproteobacteria]RTE85997.1 biopolymer transporter ExbD [Aliidiomarina sp. B3213]TCZ91351.1 biopolymer transporter ExbD [Lysobacter sp. N42]